MIRAKKSLGQNFLHSKKILSDIVRAGDIKSGDIVLEVGPGKGALTQVLLASARQVIAVEKDDRLISLLQEKFKKEIEDGKLHLVHEDILDFNPKSNKLRTESFSVVANIPYYITGVFLRKFLSDDVQPSRMVLMLQKEVARRIVASDGKESLLSISVKAYGKPKYIKTVPARYFSPAPKVDSAILLIEDISKKFFHNNNIKEGKFFELVKLGFSHKRKVLISNLKSVWSAHVDQTDFKDSSLKKFQACNISEKARAENLKLEDWKCLLEI